MGRRFTPWDGAAVAAGATIARGGDARSASWVYGILPGSSTLTDGTSATFTGSWTGLTAPTIKLIERFDTGTNGAAVSTTPQVGTYLASPGGVYDSAIKHSGNFSLLRAGGGAGSLFGSPEVDITGNDEVYLAFWWHWTGGTVGPSGSQVKTNQLWGTPAPGSYSGSPLGNFAPGVFWGNSKTAASQSEFEDEVNFQVSREGNSNAISTYTFISNIFSKDAWHFIEFIGKQSAPSVADGQMRLLIDRQVIYSNAAVQTRDGSNYQWGKFAIGDGFTNWTATPSVRLDEIHCQHGRVRFYLHNASTLAASTLVVPQRITSLADNTLNFDTFKGALPSGSVWGTLCSGLTTEHGTSAYTMT